MRDKLDAFIRQLPINEICIKLEKKHAIDRNYTNHIIETFSNETKVTLRLIADYLLKDKRTLEVGAGLCIFSIFLKSEGYNIVALDPAEGGFDFFGKIRHEILQCYENINLEVLDIPADKLCTEKNGEFDFIFSNNVIEHIPNLNKTFSSMTSVMADGAAMAHSCPNYFVPYEPHFGIPVIKCFPILTKKLFKLTGKSDLDMWNSLNFITYFDVKKIASKNGLNVTFKKQVLFNTLLRMEQDNVFYERHAGGYINLIYSCMKKVKLLTLIKFFPAMLSTPMMFFMTTKK